MPASRTKPRQYKYAPIPPPNYGVNPSTHPRPKEKSYLAGPLGVATSLSSASDPPMPKGTRDRESDKRIAPLIKRPQPHAPSRDQKPHPVVSGSGPTIPTTTTMLALPPPPAPAARDPSLADPTFPESVLSKPRTSIFLPKSCSKS